MSQGVRRCVRGSANSSPSPDDLFPQTVDDDDGSPVDPKKFSVAAPSTEEVNNVSPGQAEAGAVLLPQPLENPRAIVPQSLAQAKEIIRAMPLDNHKSKAILKAIKVSGAQNAKVVTKLKIIAIKMTQRQFCLESACELLSQLEGDSNEGTHELQCLRATSIKINRTSDGMEEILWLRGDTPVFENEEVMICEPDNISVDIIPQTARKEPDFEASEYCRLLHVLADARMTVARTQLMEPKTRDELYVEPVDPWSDQIAPLFNDVHHVTCNI